MSDIMTGFCCGAVPMLILCGIYVLHMKSVVADIIADEKQKVRDTATLEINERVNERVKEIIGSMQVNVPVALVNESDIDWGE